MDLLRRLFGGKSAAGADEDDDKARYYYVKGKKCGAVTRVRIDMRNDLSRDDNDHFYVRKMAVDNVCYGQVELELWFDANYKEINRTITGGEITNKAEWEVAQTQATDV